MGKLKEFQNELKEFCATTTIQGLRNVTDSKQNVVSRILWMIVVIALFVCAGFGIKESIDGNNFLCVLIGKWILEQIIASSKQHYFIIGQIVETVPMANHL